MNEIIIQLVKKGFILLLKPLEEGINVITNNIAYQNECQNALVWAPWKIFEFATTEDEFWRKLYQNCFHTTSNHYLRMQQIDQAVYSLLRKGFQFKIHQEGHQILNIEASFNQNGVYLNYFDTINLDTFRNGNENRKFWNNFYEACYKELEKHIK